MKKRTQTSIGLATIGVFAILVMSNGNSRGQGIPTLLQITSPAEGTVVNPGQTVAVVVSPISGTAFSMVTLNAQRPLPSGQTLTSPPFHFSVVIPANIPTAGKY